MNLYNLTKEYGKGKGESVMWATMEVVSQALERNLSQEEYQKILKKVYCIVEGGHYNEHFAEEKVAEMFYTENGKNVYAPYWTVSQVEEIYLTVKNKLIANYNMWDFYVAINMIKSDNILLLKKWFPEDTEEQIEEKIIELTMNWLNDKDNPYGDKKVWGYFNS